MRHLIIVAIEQFGGGLGSGCPPPLLKSLAHIHCADYDMSHLIIVAIEQFAGGLGRPSEEFNPHQKSLTEHAVLIFL